MGARGDPNGGHRHEGHGAPMRPLAEVAMRRSGLNYLPVLDAVIAQAQAPPLP